jgi:hypothetical protein
MPRRKSEELPGLPVLVEARGLKELEDIEHEHGL